MAFPTCSLMKSETNCSLVRSETNCSLLRVETNCSLTEKTTRSLLTCSSQIYSCLTLPKNLETSLCLLLTKKKRKKTSLCLPLMKRPYRPWTLSPWRMDSLGPSSSPNRQTRKPFRSFLNHQTRKPFHSLREDPKRSSQEPTSRQCHSSILFQKGSKKAAPSPSHLWMPWYSFQKHPSPSHLWIPCYSFQPIHRFQPNPSHLWIPCYSCCQLNLSPHRG